MASFSHLHLHTQYSILDGATNISRLVKKASELKMQAVAITDHGNMFGVKEFHNHAIASGLKPIIGCETYVARRSIKDMVAKDDRSGHHLILLAKNITGYRNLTRLISIAWTDGFYYRPRIDKTLLRKYSEGLIASSACIGGEIPSAILRGDIESASHIIEEFKDIFGEDFYLEVQRHQAGDPRFDNDTLEKQNRVFKTYLELSKKHQVEIIATNDVHFLESGDSEAHDRLICLNTGKDLDDPDRLRYTKQEYFKTEQEMLDIFSDHPEVVTNTEHIVDKIEMYKLDHDPIMPEFPLPDGFTNKDEYLSYLTYEGAKQRWPDLTPQIKERLEFELNTIKNMGYPGYFLIVQDFLNEARKLGVSVGPGRGSAAGSAVAYSLRITDIDPIKYNLLFERFLNPDRISMPDIDIDFDDDGRELVFKYVSDKYGHDHVAHIITFGSMAAKMAIRDVARVQKLPLPDADRLAKLIPDKPGTTFEKAYEEVPELARERKSGEPLVSQTLEYAEALEGSVRQTGVHACGIIISRDPLVDHIPICTAKDAELFVTQFDGNHVEAVGLLKMDFLGLKTLSIIKDTIENIKESKGKEIDIENIDLNDELTFNLYSNGETTGLFQFESEGMRKYLKELKPNRFEDLIAMNALHRPGPMEYIPQFIRRKHGQEEINYPLPEMEKHLKDTYGITVYQEQVMLLSQELAGFTKGQADNLRKAMGKKKRDIMDKMKVQFIEGCRKNNYDPGIILKIWHDWESFAEYAFNKSHSTCYAFVSYQTAWLKAHYPAEFMAAVLSRNISDIKKLSTFMDEARRMGIEVLGPDVNESNVKFTVNRDGNIRFGLGAIKGVGGSAVEKMIEERSANGQFTSVYDFVERINLNSLNKKSIEAMVLAGAFDRFEEMRRSQFFAENEKGGTFLENLIRYGNRIRSEKEMTQQSLFGDNEGFEVVKPVPPDSAEWPKMEKLNREKEVVGIYLSSHPLDDFKFEINSFCKNSISDLADLSKLVNKEITVGGMVTEAKNGTSKNGKPYGSIILQDYTDSYRFMLFDKEYVENRNYFNPGYFLFIKGKVQKRRYREDELEVRIRKISLLTSIIDEMVKSVTIVARVDHINDDFVNELKSIINGETGNVELKFLIVDPENKITLRLFSRNRKISISKEFLSFIEKNPDLDIKVN